MEPHRLRAEAPALPGGAGRLPAQSGTSGRLSAPHLRVRQLADYLPRRVADCLHLTSESDSRTPSIHEPDRYQTTAAASAAAAAGGGGGDGGGGGVGGAVALRELGHAKDGSRVRRQVLAVVAAGDGGGVDNVVVDVV